MRSGFGLTAFLILHLIAVSSATGQVNIERRRGQEDEPGLTGQFALNLSLRTGNVRILDFGTGLRLYFVGRKFSTLFVGRGEIGFQGGERFSNGGLAHLRQIYRFRPRLQIETFAQTNYERARKLDGRILAGAGLRMKLLDEPRSSIWVGAGGMLEHEQNSIPAAARHPTETTLVRFTSYIAVRLEVSANATFVATGYYQPCIRDLGDARLLLDATLQVAITEQASLTNTIALRHDSRPVDGVVRTDFRLRTGVTYSF